MLPTMKAKMPLDGGDNARLQTICEHYYEEACAVMTRMLEKEG
jgi:hypothetical protein